MTQRGTKLHLKDDLCNIRVSHIIFSLVAWKLLMKTTEALNHESPGEAIREGETSVVVKTPGMKRPRRKAKA